MRGELKLILKSGRDTLEISKDSVYRLVSQKGLESAKYDISCEECSSSDGAFVTGVRLAGRHIRLSFEVNISNEIDDRRSFLISFFNPKTKGTLTVLRGGIERSIDYLVSEVSFSQKTVRSPIGIDLTLLCVSPYFTDPQKQADQSRTTVPCLAFPFRSLAGEGVTAGISIRKSSFSLINRGDDSVGITATLTASGGSVVNPKISLGDSFVKIIDTMTSGDVYEICTEPGKKGVRKNGARVFLFDRKSTFFSLPVGSSEVVISADSGLESLDASVTFESAYLGV